MAKQPSPRDLEARRKLGEAIGLTDPADIEECIDIMPGGSLFINYRGRCLMMDRKFGKGNWSACTVFPSEGELEIARTMKGDPPQLAAMWGLVFVRVPSGEGFMVFSDFGTCMPGNDMPSSHLKWDEKGIDIAITRGVTGAMERATGSGGPMLETPYLPETGSGMAGFDLPWLRPALTQMLREGRVRPRGGGRRTGQGEPGPGREPPPSGPSPSGPSSPQSGGNGQPTLEALAAEIGNDLLPRLNAILKTQDDPELAKQVVGIQLMLQGKSVKRPRTADNLEKCLAHFLGPKGPEETRTGGKLDRYEQAIQEVGEEPQIEEQPADGGEE